MTPVLLAAALRLGGLSMRPMHCDEAVHAMKFAELLERGHYRYDPEEYHGPTLNYFSLIPARLMQRADINEVTEADLRFVPAVFGMLLVLLPMAVRRQIGDRPVFAMMLFAAVSPALAYYSRYYIQEMLLVCFTFSAIFFGYRMVRSPKLRWAALTGFSLGLMHATKETAVIAWGAMAVSLAGMAVVYRDSLVRIKVGKFAENLGVMAVCALGVSFLFYSAFFTAPEGFVDAFRTYGTYFQRAAGTLTPHIHPWYYYLKLPAMFHVECGPVYSEIAVLVPAAVAGGFLAARFFDPKVSGLMKFVLLFTVVTGLVYSLIPYKTPWSMLTFYAGAVILAGYGAATVPGGISSRRIRTGAAMLLGAGLVHLLYLAMVVNFRYPSSPANPWVYAHPTPDVIMISQKVHRLFEAGPGGRAYYVQVICPGDDYWPLPWYFRDMEGIGWYSDARQADPRASLILTQRDYETLVVETLYKKSVPGRQSLYVPFFDSNVYLRPGVELIGLVPGDVMDALENTGKMDAAEHE